MIKYWREVALFLLVSGAIWAGYSYKGTLDELRATKDQVKSITEARQKEQKAAITQNEIDQTYQSGVQNGKLELDAAISRLNAAIRLRDSRIRNLSSAASSASQCDAGSDAELLRKNGEDRYRLASEADDTVRQLKACQALLKADREICGQK